MARQATKPTVTPRNRNYQPTQADMEENIQVRIPGGTVQEKMDNFGKAVTRAVNVQYRRK